MIHRFLFIGLSCLLAASPATIANDKKPPSVEVAQPVEREIVDYVNAGPGQVEASEHINLHARVTGYVTKVNFKPGANVKKGDVLFELDNRPYRTALEVAEARLAVAEAHVNLTKTEFDRASQLLPRKALSQEDFERAKANHIEAKAKLIVTAAELQHAKLNFEFTRVIAPIDGVIGEPKVTPGNLVKADDTLLANIDSVGPVHVRFALDESSFLLLHRLKNAKIPAAIGRAGDGGYPHQGVVDFVDSRVDTKTGAIQCRATFANAEGTFLPGMSVFVRVTVSAPYKSLVIDQRAWYVTSAEPHREIENHVFVVTDKNVVETREVKHQWHDDLLAIKSGLKATDLVIVDGFPEMKVGMKVTPKRVAMQIPAAKVPKKEKAPNEQPKSDKLKELLKERHAVLSEAARIAVAMNQVGAAPFQTVQQSQREVFDAGLELCETPNERINLLRKKLKQAEEHHQSAKARLKVDKNGAFAELQARALVLETQIQLLREEEMAKAIETDVRGKSAPDDNTLPKVKVIDGDKRPPKKVKLGVAPTSAFKVGGVIEKWDDMSKLLNELGDGYRHDELAIADIVRRHKAGTLNEYDVIFLPCSIGNDQDELKEPLSEYVSNGGILYASDWRYDTLARAFPEMVAENLRGDGEAGMVEADVVDPGLRDALGAKTIPLRFDLAEWKTAAFGGPRVTVLLQGKYRKYRSKDDVVAPLMVKFQMGKGTVFFTSFHNEKRNNRIEKQLLLYLVYSLMTAGVDAEVNSSLNKDGFEPRRSQLLTMNNQQSIQKTHESKEVCTLRFVLGFRAEGMKLRFEIKSPDGKQFTKDCLSTTILEMPNAAKGTWTITVAGLDACENFPFTVTVGEKK